MCLFVQSAAMTDGGTLERKKSEEREREREGTRTGEQEEEEVGLFHEIDD